MENRTQSVTNFYEVMKVNEKANVLVCYTIEQIKSILFKIVNRTMPQYFTRKSPLDFKNTTLLILRMVKKSSKAELMDYFHDAGEPIEIPSRQALAQAREKISHLAFKDFFDKSCELVISDNEPELYKGYRLFAIDGTSFVVGELSKLSEYFGDSTTVSGKAMCRLSAVVDVLSDSIANAIVSPFCVGERALAISQTEVLESVHNALFLFDRGYWSPELVEKIIGNGQKFLMRLTSTNSKSCITDETGVLHHLRRYSFILPSGNEEVLLTNIPESEMSDDELAALYAKRWGVETKYLELKARLQIDKFSGESTNIVLQDIYSTLYISNLVAFICESSDEIIEEKTADKGNKYKQKANRAVCISALRRRFVGICLSDDPQTVTAALQRLCDDISRSVSYVGKSKPRHRNKRIIKDSRRRRLYKPIL